MPDLIIRMILRGELHRFRSGVFVSAYRTGNDQKQQQEKEEKSANNFVSNGEK